MLRVPRVDQFTHHRRDEVMIDRTKYGDKPGLLLLLLVVLLLLFVPTADFTKYERAISDAFGHLRLDMNSLKCLWACLLSFIPCHEM